MFYRSLLFICTLFLFACATPPSIAPISALKGNYKLDPTHASVTWSLSHAGLSNYTARFDEISGQLDFNPDAPQTSLVNITINPQSVSTGLPKFDDTLAFDSQYFDARTYPEIRFVSETLTLTGDNTATMTGTLTLKGISKAVTLDVTYNGAGSSFGNPGKTLGFSAQGHILRSEFNMGHLKNFGIGDRVTLRIETEFNEAR